MRTSTLFVSLVLTLVVTACNASHPQEGPGNATDSAGTPTTLAGRVTIDGSSTVLPVSTVLADAFHVTHPKVEISIHESGTAGGFRKFCAGEIDITGASRPINASEIAECDSAGVELIELPFAFDSLAVVRNAANAFATCLTIGELRTIWQPEAERKVTSWRQVRGEFPDSPLTLFGPGKASGTFDYFTLAIVGRQSHSRTDYTRSEDDTVLVNGVAGDANALGYFGYAYYAANKSRLKLVAVDSGQGCVEPSPEALQTGRYQPLSRPLFIYASRKSMLRAEAKALAEFFVSPENAPQVERIGYVALPPATLLSVGRRLDQNVTGSIFGGQGSVLGVTAATFHDEDALKSALVR